ncbi:Helicase associated domain protein [Prescottella equi]
MPHRWLDENGFLLGAWVSRRRTDRRRRRPSLTPERITELDNLDFDWGTTRTKH